MRVVFMIEVEAEQNVEISKMLADAATSSKETHEKYLDGKSKRVPRARHYRVRER